MKSMQRRTTRPKEKGVTKLDGQRQSSDTYKLLTVVGGRKQDARLKSMSNVRHAWTGDIIDVLRFCGDLIYASSTIN